MVREAATHDMLSVQSLSILGNLQQSMPLQPVAMARDASCRCQSGTSLHFKSFKNFKAPSMSRSDMQLIFRRFRFKFSFV